MARAGEGRHRLRSAGAAAGGTKVRGSSVADPIISLETATSTGANGGGGQAASSTRSIQVPKATEGSGRESMRSAGAAAEKRWQLGPIPARAEATVGKKRGRRTFSEQ